MGKQKEPKRRNTVDNFNIKKQREALYTRTFMKKSIESRLATLHSELASLSTKTMLAAINLNKEHLLELAEGIAAVETCIDFVKFSINGLDEASTNIKHGKLKNLKDRTDEKEGLDAIKKEEHKTE